MTEAGGLSIFEVRSLLEDSQRGCPAGLRERNPSDLDDGPEEVERPLVAFFSIRLRVAMPVITICRGVPFGGEAVAEQVAHMLRYRCVGTELLTEASRRYGIPEAKLNRILEREPYWWEQWLEGSRRYRTALKAVICEFAAGAELVYHGHVGHELLPHMRHVVKVLLTAPLEFRITQVQVHRKMDETGARRYVESLDKAHTRRLMTLFNVDWQDPTRYDLTVNLAQVSSTAASALIAQLARQDIHQPTSASNREFANTALAARVEAELMTHPKFRDLPLNIQAEGNQVNVWGLLPTAAARQEIIRLIEGLPGVAKVRIESSS